MKIQSPNEITKPEDVESFDVEASYNRFVGPALDYASSWLNENGVPYVFMTTIKSIKKVNDEGNTFISGTHNVRSNNVSLVRDFALCFAHEAIAARNHVQLGQRFAELGCKSPEFMGAFFQHLKDTGHIASVTNIPPGTVH